MKGEWGRIWALAQPFSQPPGCAENELLGNYFGADSLHCVSAHGSHGPLRIGAAVPLV